MLKKLKLCIIGAFGVLGSPAFADQDCSQINTIESAQNLNSEVVKTCAQNDGMPLFEKPTSAGRIFLHNVIGSSVHSNDIDTLFSHSSADSWTKQLAKTDRSGRTVMQIAVEEAKTPEILLRLILLGGDISSETKWSDYDALARSLMLEGREDYAAVLLALGEEPKIERYASSTAEALANPEDYSPEIDPRVYKRSEICADSPSDLERDTLEEAQQNYCAAHIYAKDPLKTDPDGNTFLHSAIKIGFGLEFIDAFLSNIDDDEGWFFGSKTDNRDRVLTSTNVEGFTALGMAAKFSKDPNVITHLIGWGADPNAPQGKVREQNLLNKVVLQNPKADRSLHLVALRTDDLRFKMMLRLLAGGASPLSQDAKGNTALHLLLRKSDTQPNEVTVDEIALLMQVEEAKQWFSGENEVINNDAGATPLHLAVARDLDFLVFQELVSFGADPDTLNNSDNKEGAMSALFHYGHSGKDPDVFELMLDASKNACEISVEGNSLQAVLAKNKTLRETKTDGGELAMSLFKKKCP